MIFLATAASVFLFGAGPFSELADATGIGEAEACSPARGSLEEVYPGADQVIPPDTTFTVVYSGASNNRGADAADVTLTTSSGMEVPVEFQGSIGHGIAGEYLRFAPGATLEPGDYELQVTLNAGGSGGDNRTLEMTRSYEVRQDANGADPAPVGSLEVRTGKREGAAMCYPTHKARLSFQFPADTVAPAYAVVRMESQDGSQSVRRAIPGTELAGPSVEQTLSASFSVDCVEIKTVNRTGSTSMGTSTCDTTDCGSLVEDDSYQIDWEQSCPDEGGDGDTGVSNDGGPDAGTNWSDTGSSTAQSGSGGCSIADAGAGPQGGFGGLLFVLVFCVTIRRRYA